MRKILDNLLARLGYMRKGQHRLIVAELCMRLKAARDELATVKAELHEVKRDRAEFARPAVKAAVKANRLLNERRG